MDASRGLVSSMENAQSLLSRHHVNLLLDHPRMKVQWRHARLFVVDDGHLRRASQL